MANKAMKERHWERLSKLCVHKFDVDSDSFTLANILEADLNKYKDDVEVRYLAHSDRRKLQIII